MVDFSDIEPYAHSTQGSLKSDEPNPTHHSGSLKSESLHQAQSNEAQSNEAQSNEAQPNEAQSNEANFATPTTSEAEPRIAPQRPSDEIIRKRQEK